MGHRPALRGEESGGYQWRAFLLARRHQSKFNVAVKASELFGVFIRLAGFLIVIYGLWELWGGAETIVSNLLPSDNNDQTSSFTFFADGIPAVIVGILIFFLADWIVRLAYGKSEA